MKSPIKERPLNNPGESLERRVQEIRYDEYLAPAIWATFAVVMAGLEWWRWFFQTPLSPWAYTILAVAVVAYAVRKILKACSKVKNYEQGLEGEKSVGQFLETLRSKGALVLHDIGGDGFNLDHVVIHPTGIYVIETKALSKPDQGKAELIFDGERITKDGMEQDRNPLTQVTAQSRWLRDQLKESTGHTFPIRPVVLYPGWYVKPTDEARGSHVWVLNPTGLPVYMAHEEEKLSPEDMHLCHSRMALLVRSKA